MDVSDGSAFGKGSVVRREQFLTDESKLKAMQVLSYLGIPTSTFFSPSEAGTVGDTGAGPSEGGGGKDIG